MTPSRTSSFISALSLGIAKSSAYAPSQPPRRVGRFRHNTCRACQAVPNWRRIIAARATVPSGQSPPAQHQCGSSWTGDGHSAQEAASVLASKLACRAGRDCLVLRSLLCLGDALAFQIKLSSSHRVAGRGSFVLAWPNYGGRDERSASSALLGLDCSGFESSFRLRSVLPSAT